MGVANLAIGFAVIIVVCIRKNRGRHNIMHMHTVTTTNDENQDCNLSYIFYDYPTADHPIPTEPNKSYAISEKRIKLIETEQTVSYGISGTQMTLPIITKGTT